MKVLDPVTGQAFDVDEAYERFFDGFYNLGRPSDVLQSNVAVSVPRVEPARARQQARKRKTRMTQRARRRLAGRR